MEIEVSKSEPTIEDDVTFVMRCPDIRRMVGIVDACSVEFPSRKPHYPLISIGRWVFWRWMNYRHNHWCLGSFECIRLSVLEAHQTSAKQKWKFPAPDTPWILWHLLLVTPWQLSTAVVCQMLLWWLKKNHIIISVSEILPQTRYHCVQYAKHHHIIQFLHC